MLCALMRSMTSPLRQPKFNRSELRTMLKEGDEVTTSTDTYGRVRGQVGTVVQVEIDGDVRQCARDTLHLRHWVTKAFFGLTNDRKQYAALIKALLPRELSCALTGSSLVCAVLQ